MQDSIGILFERIFTTEQGFYQWPIIINMEMLIQSIQIRLL